MRYSLPGHHCRSSQTLPYTTDPKCPAPSRHKIRAWLLSHPDLRRISAACCEYLRCPYRSDNHIPHNLPSLPAWPASPRRRSRAWQAPPSPADRPDSRCHSRSPPCWWQRKQSGSDRRDFTSDTNFFITNSAMGERQMLPWQMNNTFIIVFVIPFASLKAQTSYEKCCAPPLFDL